MLGSESAHYYNAEGAPCFEVPYADKSKGMRPVTLRDAKKMRLYPSVTTIIDDTLRKYGLDIYKGNQLIDATWAHLQAWEEWNIPIGVREPSTEDRDEIRIRARQHSSDAADFGTNVHTFIYKFLDTGYCALDDDLAWLAEWLGDQDLKTTYLEMPFISNKRTARHGGRIVPPYGGTIDFLGWWGGNGVIIDWKTQATKPGKPINVYQTWGTQLAAYADARDSDLDCYNVVISSTEPGRIEVVEWDCRDILDHGDYFECLYYLWCSPLVKGWTPK